MTRFNETLILFCCWKTADYIFQKQLWTGCSACPPCWSWSTCRQRWCLTVGQLHRCHCQLSPKWERKTQLLHRSRLYSRLLQDTELEKVLLLATWSYHQEEYLMVVTMSRTSTSIMWCKWWEILCFLERKKFLHWLWDVREALFCEYRPLSKHLILKHYLAKFRLKMHSWFMGLP